jgi:hypothetical protein
MVAKKLAGCSVSLLRIRARLSPDADSWTSLFLFKVRTAISALANKAFRTINVNCSRNNHNKGLSVKITTS